MSGCQNDRSLRRLRTGSGLEVRLRCGRIRFSRSFGGTGFAREGWLAQTSAFAALRVDCTPRVASAGQTSPAKSGGGGSRTRVRKYHLGRPYVRVPVCVSRPAWEWGANRQPPAPFRFTRTRRSLTRGLACEDDIQPRLTGSERGGRSLSVKQRERAAYSQLGLFHRIYEEMALGTHLPRQYLRRSRIAPMESCENPHVRRVTGR